MKTIKLTQGQVAIVDDKNYNWLNQYKWHAWYNGYTYYAERSDYTTNKLQTVRMHRQILGLKHGDGKQIDHINHNGLDNREYNIRVCTHSENLCNKQNVKGYCWDKSVCKWKATIRFNGKQYNLGCFDNKNDAHKAYLRAKKEYHKS